MNQEKLKVPVKRLLGVTNCQVRNFFHLEIDFLDIINIGKGG